MILKVVKMKSIQMKYYKTRNRGVHLRPTKFGKP